MSLDTSYYKEQVSICFGVGILEMLGLLYSIDCGACPRRTCSKCQLMCLIVTSNNIIEPRQCGTCDQKSLISPCAYS